MDPADKEALSTFMQNYKRTDLEKKTLEEASTRLAMFSTGFFFAGNAVGMLLTRRIDSRGTKIFFTAVTGISCGWYGMKIGKQQGMKHIKETLPEDSVIRRMMENKGEYVEILESASEEELTKQEPLDKYLQTKRRERSKAKEIPVVIKPSE